ncbi:hypothetical protein Tco_0115511 [Tanacetum coccineum]
MKKFPSISSRSEEDYHSIKDDIPLGSVYTIGNVTVRGMMIPGELLIDDIRVTKEYKEYKEKFVRVDVLIIQQEPVESTQGTHRTPRATRTPTPTTEKKRKSREFAGESSTPRKSMKIIIKQKQPSTTLIPHPSNDEEEDSHASAFAYSVLRDKEDTETRIEPGSHKEHPEIVNEDDDDVVGMKINDDDKEDDNDDQIDHALVRGKVSSGLESRNEQMQTPIPHPLDPLGLSSSKDVQASRHYDQENGEEIYCIKATNEIIENNLSRVLVKEIMKEKDTYQETVPAVISKEFADHVPKMIKELFQTYIQNSVITVHPATSSSTVIPSSVDLQHRLTDTFHGTDNDDHQEDDGPLEGEKWSKSQKISSN